VTPVGLSLIPLLLRCEANSMNVVVAGQFILRLCRRGDNSVVPSQEGIAV